MLRGRETGPILSRELGREVRYVDVGPEGIAQALRQMGASESVASGYAKLMAGINQLGLDYRSEPRNAESTTPTTFAAFVQQTLRPLVEGRP